jgi:hypothetical protein
MVSSDNAMRGENKAHHRRMKNEAYSYTEAVCWLAFVAFVTVVSILLLFIPNPFTKDDDIWWYFSCRISVQTVTMLFSPIPPQETPLRENTSQGSECGLRVFEPYIGKTRYMIISSIGGTVICFYLFVHFLFSADCNNQETNACYIFQDSTLQMVVLLSLFFNSLLQIPKDSELHCNMTSHQRVFHIIVNVFFIYFSKKQTFELLSKIGLGAVIYTLYSTRFAFSDCHLLGIIEKNAKCRNTREMNERHQWCVVKDTILSGRVGKLVKFVLIISFVYSIVMGFEAFAVVKAAGNT